MGNITGDLLFAAVEPDASGITLRIWVDGGKSIQPCFLPVGERMGDISLVLRPGMNPKTELEKVANLLMGFRTLPDGSLDPIPGFVPKKVNIANQA